MNKNVKGGIAAGAGLLLLLGGGGTFALWNDAQSANGGTVASGELSLTDGGTGTWYEYADYVANGSSATPINIASYHVVPEDELIFVSADIEITAEGSNLFYTFDSNVDEASAAGLGYTVTLETSDFTLPATALPGTALTAVAAEYAGPSGNIAAGTTVYSYTSTTPETVEFTVGLKVVFDADNQDNFNEELDLSALEFVLQQVVKL